jgi:formylglycine-generating enzyme required for sulfatase activity
MTNQSSISSIAVEVGTRGRGKIRSFVPGGGKAEWFKDIDIGPEMVVVPAGNFAMGSPESEPEREGFLSKRTESPQHTVVIRRPFAVGRLAVTREQFAAFVSASGRHISEGFYIWTDRSHNLLEHDPKASWRNPGFPQDDSHPVVGVDWNNAKAFAAWLAQVTGWAYRLLTEAEWEYVTRAGTATPFWWGSSITPVQANYDGGATVPAASFAPNPWGLYNVHGNVWEWCEDIWHDTYNGAPTDGSAWTDGGDAKFHVLRGGSWNFAPRHLRSAFRGPASDYQLCNDQGFRVARELSS